MLWLVEVTPLGKGDPQSFTVEAETWQKALQAARAKRGDDGPMSGFSIELLEEGYRAVDPVGRLRFVVKRAPDQVPAPKSASIKPDAPSVPPSKTATLPGLSDAPSIPPAPSSDGARPKIKTIAYGSDGEAVVAPSVPPGAASALPVVGSTTEGQPPVTICTSREEEPRDGAPLTYREYGFATVESIDEEAAESLLRAQLAIVVAHLHDKAFGKLVNLAVFDVVFTGKPPRPPIATLTWKDWKTDAVIGFPRRGVGPSKQPAPPSQLPPSLKATAIGVAPPANRPTGAAASHPPAEAPASQAAPAPDVAKPVSVAPVVPAAPAGGSADALIVPTSKPVSMPPPAPAEAAKKPSVAPAAEAAKTASVAPPKADVPKADEPKVVIADEPKKPSVAPAAEAVEAAKTASVAPPKADVPKVDEPKVVIADEPKKPSVAPAAEAVEAAKTASVAPPKADVPKVDEPKVVIADEPKKPSVAPAAEAVEAAKTASVAPPKADVPKVDEPKVVIADAAPATSTNGAADGSEAPSRRVSGDELITSLFEAMHDLHFLRDALDGGQFCLTLATDALPATAALIHFFDVEKREWIVACTRGKQAGSLLATRTTDGDAILRDAARQRRAIVVDRSSEAPESERYKQLGAGKSLIAAPIMQAGRVLGALEIIDPLDGQPFTEDEAHAVTYIAEQYAEYLGSRGIVLDRERIRRSAPL